MLSCTMTSLLWLVTAVVMDALADRVFVMPAVVGDHVYVFAVPTNALTIKINVDSTR